MARKNYNGIDYDDSMDYASLMDQAAAARNNEKAAIYERKRNAKIKGEGLDYETTNQYEQYLPKVDTPYDSVTDYATLMDKAAASGDYTSAARYEKQRNAKIKGEGLDYETSDYYSQYLPENRYTYDPSKNGAFSSENRYTYDPSKNGASSSENRYTYDPSKNGASSSENRYTYDPSKNDAYQRANDQATAIYDKIMNRGEFSYDVNKDKLYQQYRDLYAQMGRGAMEDTIGQAAALTGGYGSTYSQNAGQQAYNSYLQKLNEVVPELYNAAYNRYNQEGQNLMNLYTMARSNADSAYERDYNQWYNRLQLERSDEDTAYNRWYNQMQLERSDEDTAYNRWYNQMQLERRDDDTAYNRWYNRLQLERSDEDTAYNRHQTEEQKKLVQEETDYERKQNAWSRLSSLITTTGYQPSDEELAAAGMSANEAAYLRQYYQQKLEAASNKSGGSGGGSSRSRGGYGGGGTQPEQPDSPSPYAHKPGSGITHNDIDYTDTSAVKDSAAVAGRVQEMINEGVPIADVNTFIRSASENGLISDDSARRLRYMNNSRK